MALILPSRISTESCLLVNTSSTSVTVTDKSNSLLTVGNEDSFDLLTLATSVVNLDIGDVLASQLTTDTWCTSWPTATPAHTITSASLLESTCGVTFDGTDQLIAFTPPDITTCTDDDSDRSIWKTWIETAPENSSARVTVDLDNAQIRINGVSA